MPSAKVELKKECIRLRVDERLSFNEIKERTGASKGSLSSWLCGYPLTHQELESRRSPVPTPIKKPRGLESELHRIVRSHSHNSSGLGKVGEAAVLLRLLARGFNVYGSTFDGDTVDWAVETPSLKMVKVQVKTVREFAAGHGVPAVSLRRKHGSERYTKGSFDFIVGFDIFTDTAYVWSWEEVEHLNTSVSISKDAAERWDKLLV